MPTAPLSVQCSALSCIPYVLCVCSHTCCVCSPAPLHTQARYLKDALDEMLNQPAYLDSSTLADLRELFTAGVDASEVLVLMLTPGLLTRPWCLLEIRQAMRKAKPIVLLELQGPGKHFGWEDAATLLGDLEAHMPSRNPYCLQELYAHLDADEGLADLQGTLQAALELGRMQRVAKLNINGTANQLEAELVDLVECLAAATGRSAPKWKGGSRLADKLSLQAAKKSRVRHSPNHSSGSGGSSKGGASRLQASGGSYTRNSVQAAQYISSSVYIVHATNAHEDAARLQALMERVVLQRCYCEAPDTLERMVACLNLVAQAKYVILLQTKEVLSETWALLATYRASLAGVPLVCVAVEGGGYAFHEARGQLQALDSGAHLSAEALTMLQHVLTRFSPPSDVRSLQERLATLVPAIISVVYHPQGTSNEGAATVHDIQDKRALLQDRRTATADGEAQDDGGQRRGHFALRRIRKGNMPSPKTGPQEAPTELADEMLEAIMPEEINLYDRIRDPPEAVAAQKRPQAAARNVVATPRPAAETAAPTPPAEATGIPAPRKGAAREEAQSRWKTGDVTGVPILVQMNETSSCSEPPAGWPPSM